MLWIKKPLTEAEEITEDAVALACRKFAIGPLHGSDYTGWFDTESLSDGRTLNHQIAYQPRGQPPRLTIGGRAFELTDAQATRINNTIGRRVIHTFNKKGA